MSLLDIMNCSVYGFVKALQILSMEMADSGRKAHIDPNSALAEEHVEGLIKNLDFITHECRQLLLRGAEERLGRIYTGLRLGNRSYAALSNELNFLGQTIEDDLRYEYFFHYRRDKALLIPRIPEDWAGALRQFPSARKEIEEGIDCYGLEHNAACMFHMMRIAEIGMRALARERKVTFPNHPLEWAEWENVIDQIELKARAATNGMPRGPQRDAARAFYTAAVAQLRAFKETRNRIMHMRGNFNELVDSF